MKYVTIAFFIFCALASAAQNKKPSWISNLPTSKKGIFTYIKGKGTHHIEDSASQRAYSDMITELARNKGQTYILKSASDRNIKETTDTIKIVDTYVRTITVRGQKFSTHIQSIDHYYKNDEYYGLYRVTDNKDDLKKPIFTYPDFKKKMAFLPGVAQFKKKEKAKGTFFIAGEVALLTGIGISQILYSDYDADFQYYLALGDMDNADIMKSNRDKVGIVRTSCIIGAVGLYAYNLIDGWFSKGKPEGYTQRSYKVYPNLAHNTVGVTFSLHLK